MHVVTPPEALECDIIISGWLLVKFPARFALKVDFLHPRPPNQNPGYASVRSSFFSTEPSLDLQ